MKNVLFLLAFALTGCSNAPLAGFLDAVHPSRGKPADATLPRVLDDARSPRIEQ